MNDTPLYSSKLTKNYAEYLKKHYPDIDLMPLLEYAGIALHQLADEGHWLTQNQVDRFNKIVVQKTHNPDISRDVGRYTPFSVVGSTFLNQYMLTFLSPALAYTKLEKAYNYVSRGCRIQVKSRGANTMDIVATPNPGVMEKAYQCQNRIGILEAIAKLFTGKLATIQHPVCLHNDGDSCHYIVSWEQNRSVLWKRIRNALILFSIIAGPLFLLRLPLSHSILPISLSLLTVAIVSLYQTSLEKKEEETRLIGMGDASKRLMEQINITYNHAVLIQKIGQASASILDIDSLSSHIMKAIEECLDFDRGIIMLANTERTHLVFKEAYGYEQTKAHFAKGLSFHLDNPESKGHFVLAFKQQRPFLVNNLQEIENSFSTKSYEIAKAMGIRSFICVPIVYEGRSEGILAVDNVRSKRMLNQSDLNLLLGIAPHIGISINNARTYQKVRESEERFKALGENSPDIVYTLDAKGLFTYINPAWEKLLGHTKTEIMGRYFIEFIHKDDEADMVRIFKRIRDKGETVKNVTRKVFAKDGSRRHFSLSGSPNFDSQGNLIGLVGTMKDVTALEENLDQLQTVLEGTIRALSSIVESRDPYTAGHQRRVTALACAIAEEMDLPKDTINSIRTAAMIHDIGKIYIPAEILNKPGTISTLEFDMIKTHAEVGYNVLKNIDFSGPVAQIVRQHHERLDGSGYPQGISGADILIESKIIAVADTLEAMTNHRPYRPSLGLESALQEISESRAVLFDAEVVDCCMKLLKEKSFNINGD